MRVKIKHAMLELFCCMSLDLLVLFSPISKEMVLSIAASVQGQPLLFFSNQFVQFIVEDGLCSRPASIQENIVYNCNVLLGN